MLTLRCSLDLGIVMRGGERASPVRDITNGGRRDACWRGEIFGVRAGDEENFRHQSSLELLTLRNKHEDEVTRRRVMPSSVAF